MDPASLAGLGLGAASIAFQVLQGIKKGYDVFEAAVDMPEDCASLRLRLRLECSRLLDWGDVAGLSERNNHANFDRTMRMNRATSMAVLGEMRTLIETLQELGLRSIEALPPENLTGTEMDQAEEMNEAPDLDLEVFRATLQFSEALSMPQRKRGTFKGLRHVMRISRGIADVARRPASLRWALRDKDKFLSHLGRLKELTDFLHESLGEHQMNVLLETTKETYMAMLQMTSSVSEMMGLFKAANVATAKQGFEAGERPWLSLGEVSEGLAAAPQQTLFAQLAQLRYSVASLQNDPSASDGFQRMRFREDQVETLELRSIETNGASRTLATYRGETVWIEWKGRRSIRYRDQSGKFQFGPPSTITANLERLVAILRLDNKPKQFRAPLCAGYFDDADNERFGLVYRLPGAWQPGELTSLSQVLGGNMPALRRRINLAVELATSLYFLHAVNWLHKGLRSQSIIFPLSDGAPNYGEPCISGFEYSRPDEGDLTTTAAPEDREWAIYSHPDYQGLEKKKYRKTFDIYSLGIVLLEIALWKPAEAIMGFDILPSQDDTSQHKTFSKDSLSDLKGVRNRILSDEPDILENVRRTMGDRYHDAVRVCIEGLTGFNLRLDADETQGVVATLLQQEYLCRVVDVLRSIRV